MTEAARKRNAKNTATAAAQKTNPAMQKHTAAAPLHTAAVLRAQPPYGTQSVWRDYGIAAGRRRRHGRSWIVTTPFLLRA